MAPKQNAKPQLMQMAQELLGVLKEGEYVSHPFGDTREGVSKAHAAANVLGQAKLEAGTRSSLAFATYHQELKSPTLTLKATGLDKAPTEKDIAAALKRAARGWTKEGGNYVREENSPVVSALLGLSGIPGPSSMRRFSGEIPEERVVVPADKMDAFLAPAGLTTRNLSRVRSAGSASAVAAR